MKNCFIIKCIFLLTVLSVFGPGCKPATTTESPAEGEEAVAERVYKEAPMIDPDEFEKGINRSKAVLVDVRMPQEFEQGHMEGAINMNFFDPNFKNQLLDLDKNKRYYIYCKNDARSERAAEFLLQNDYPEVYVLKGGYEAWKAAGKN